MRSHPTALAGAIWAAALFAASLCAHAAPTEPTLHGCWRSTHIALFFQDGSRTDDRSGRCTLQFGDDRIESSCGTSGGSAVTTYRYRVVRPNVYSATMTGSTFRTDLIGSSREYEFRIEEDRLLLVTHPQTTTPAPPTAAVRVESESKRMPCP